MTAIIDPCERVCVDRTPAPGCVPARRGGTGGRAHTHTQTISLPAKWQAVFDSITASNMLIGGQSREHAEAVALRVVERGMRATPFGPRRDPESGETAVERSERYLRECGGLPPGTRRARP